MSRAFYSLVGLAGLGTASWIGWQVADELLHQAHMQPMVDDAVQRIQQSPAARRMLGPPPYRVHGSGRHSIRPTFQSLADPHSGGHLDKAIFWIEGAGGMGRVVAVGEGHPVRSLTYVGLEVQGQHPPLVVFNRLSNRHKKEGPWARFSSLFRPTS